METLNNAVTASAAQTALEPFVIHPATYMGAVSLTVANLDRQIAFYQDVLGLRLHWREGGAAGLGAGGEDLLKLIEQPEARRARGTTGLYHFAVLFPSTRELARRIGRLFSLRYLNYPTDHILTETTYLDDPEGNGIELYADTPERGTWGFENGAFMARDAQGRVRSGRDPLDVEALFRELQAGDRLEEPAPPETKMGHVHLHVADIPKALGFYHDLLGFENQIVSAEMGAAFISAGGYHHHLGLNTWAGQGAPPPPPGSLGLRHYAVVLPNEAELQSLVARVRQAGAPMEESESGALVRDPFQNGVLLMSQK